MRAQVFTMTNSCRTAAINWEPSAAYLRHNLYHVSRRRSAIGGSSLTRRVLALDVDVDGCGAREHAAVLRPVEERAQNRHGDDKPHRSSFSCDRRPTQLFLQLATPKTDIYPLPAQLSFLQDSIRSRDTKETKLLLQKTIV